MIPLIKVCGTAMSDDLDLVVAPAEPKEVAADFLSIVLRVLTRQYTPKLFARGNTDFQMTRGLLGVSL